jgi:hypothetical protein
MAKEERTVPKPNPYAIIEAWELCSLVGFCFACGKENYKNVEPDTYRGKCESCGYNEVFVPQSLLMWAMLERQIEEME